MEHLILDVINVILNLLDKDSSFNILNTAKYFQNHKTMLYEKYLFKHTTIQRQENIKKHIRHIKHTNLISNDFYPNIESFVLNKNNFNQPLINLPQLKSLTIQSNNFNQSLDMLPQSLQSLTIEGSSFNSPIESLSALINLRHLSIESYSFNQPLNNLPNTLHTLKIKNYAFDNVDKLSRPEEAETCHKSSTGFNQPLDKLPQNLHTFVMFSNAFDKNLDNLPQSLKKLILLTCDNKYSMSNLPQELDSLLIDDAAIHFSLNNLPKDLRSLVIRGIIFNPINNLPNKLHSLEIISYNASPKITNLPETLLQLTVKTNGKNKINIPKSVEICKIRTYYTRTINISSTRIHTLSMHCGGIKRIDKFPSSCETLHLCSYSNTNNAHIPMDNIKHLTLKNCNVTEIFINKLPIGLQSLELKNTITPKIVLGNFPNMHTFKINGIEITK